MPDLMQLLDGPSTKFMFESQLNDAGLPGPVIDPDTDFSVIEPYAKKTLLNVLLHVRPGDQLDLRTLDSLPAKAKLSLWVSFANPENAKPGWKDKYLTKLLEYERPNLLGIQRLTTSDYERLLTHPTNRNIDLSNGVGKPPNRELADKELEKRLQNAGYFMGQRSDRFYREWGFKLN